jgi:transcriptional regulator with GAF, ATPase, and Fis domain
VGFRGSLETEPRLAAPTTGLGHLVATKWPVHILDCANDIAYAERDRMRVQTVELGGVHTTLVVPLLQGDTILGGLQICRQEARPFTRARTDPDQPACAGGGRGGGDGRTGR